MQKAQMGYFPNGALDSRQLMCFDCALQYFPIDSGKCIRRRHMISFGWILSDVPNHKWNALVPLPPTSGAESSCMTHTPSSSLSGSFPSSLAHSLDGWLSSAFCLRCHTNEWVSWEYVILWKGHRRHVYHITVNDNKKNNLCKSIFEVIFIPSYCVWFYLSLLLCCWVVDKCSGKIIGGFISCCTDGYLPCVKRTSVIASLWGMLKYYSKWTHFWKWRWFFMYPYLFRQLSMFMVCTGPAAIITSSHMEGHVSRESVTDLGFWMDPADLHAETLH